jgi:serine/threonine protein phosphatase PrpC
VAGLTDVGRQRKHNEDHVLIKAEKRLFAVADGMGGHNAGDVASKLTTTSLGNFFEATADGETPIELPDDYRDLSADARRLVAGVRKANRDVFVISSTTSSTTGWARRSSPPALRQAMEMHIAHVGDSRCYRIRDGAIKQLTRDHSLINDALELKPDLAAGRARAPPAQHHHARARDEGRRQGRHQVRPLAAGDMYLLCSTASPAWCPTRRSSRSST